MTFGPLESCPDYRPEKDFKYTTCHYENLTQDPCVLLRNAHKAKAFRSYFLAIIPFGLSCCAVIVNSLFIYLVYLHVFRKNRSSKKRYTFLINRSVSAVIAQVLLYIVLITWKAKELQYSTTAMFLGLLSLSMLVQTGTYLIVTWMLYRAVIHPFWYKEKITMCLCLWSITGIWLLSLAVSIIFGVLGATLFYPDSKPIPCDFDHCQNPMAITVVIIFLFSFFAVITFYLVMVLRIRLKTSNISDLNQRLDGCVLERSPIHDRNIRTLNRLSLNLVAFSISKLPLLIVAVIALANLKNLSKIGLGAKSPCKTFEYGDIFYEVEVLASISAILWLFGMNLDPVITIGSDQMFMEDLRKRYKRVCFFFLRTCGNRKSPNGQLASEPTFTEETNSEEF